MECHIRVIIVLSLEDTKLIQTYKIIMDKNKYFSLSVRLHVVVAHAIGEIFFFVLEYLLLQREISEVIDAHIGLSNC